VNGCHSHCTSFHSLGIIRGVMKLSWRTLLILFLAGLLAGCQPAAPVVDDPAPVPTDTSLPPSPTPIPSAAFISGEPILLSDYLAEVARFEDAQAALGIDLASLEEYPLRVLDALIDRKLLAQGAVSAGFAVSQEELEAAYQQILADHGGESAFAAWLQANHYQEGTFLAALEEDLLAARMVDQIASGVSRNAEHVRARHILVSDAELAGILRQRLLNGEDFAQLAAQYSQDFSTRINGGDLGWFARGTLTMQNIDDVAFSQELNSFSPVLESDLGFHVLEVLDRSERELSPQSWQRMREQAVLGWRAQARQDAVIEVVSDPG
jgi:peptidyl-prolyl cis-trans isomerase C